MKSWLLLATITAIPLATDACTAFDISSPGAQSILNGINAGPEADRNGLQTMLNRALGQQTHSGNPIELGKLITPPPNPIDKSDWVTDAAQLSCYDFDEACLWKNMEGLFVDEMDWYQGSGFLDQGRLQVATGTHISPDGYYSIVATDHAQLPTSKAVLVSDTIACQLGPGEIQFLYWTSPEVHVKVCTKKISALYPQFDYCSPPVDVPRPGPVKISVPDVGREPFQLFIIAENFVFSATALQGGFAMLDNLEYYADMCPEGEEGAEGAATLSPPGNSILGANKNIVFGLGVTTSTPFPKLISIDEQESEFGGLSEQTTGKNGMSMRSTLTRRGPLPSKSMKNTLEGSSGEQRLHGRKTQKISRSSAESATLSSRRRGDEDSDEETTSAIEREIEHRLGMLPEEEEGENEDRLEEDEEEFEDKTGKSAAIKTRPPMLHDLRKPASGTSIKQDACDVLNCRFEGGDCAKLVENTDWRISDRPIGNPLSGIKGDASLLPYNRVGTFAYIRGPRTHSRLTTAAFRLQEEAFLVFAYHKVDRTSSLRVYSKSSDSPKEQLLFDAPVLTKHSARRWFREGRVLPQGDYDYIAFEVHSLGASSYIGIDEILILNTKRQLMCP